MDMVKIFSDSTCDLSKELIDRYDVGILPLHVILGEKDYLDGEGVTPEQIYQWSDENRTTPKTSAISMDRTMDAFRPYVQSGTPVVCFSISQHMSTSGNVMRLAAEELGAQELVTVIDSQNLSTGVGLLVLEAASMAREGKTAAEIAARIEELRPRVRASFVVDTLTYLHRGGRCSGLAALLGGTLKLHPRIAVTEGKMLPGKKYRGKMSRVIADYVRDMEAELRAARPNRVFITHSGCDKAIVEETRAYLESLGHFEEIHETRAGGVISCHCGPGTLGVLFIAGEE